MGKEEHLSFWQLAKRAAMEGKTLIGYLELRTIARFKPTAIINPTEKVKLKFWTDVDLILLAPGGAQPQPQPADTSFKPVAKKPPSPLQSNGVGAKDVPTLEIDAVQDRLVRAMDAWHEGKCFYKHEGQQGVSLPERVAELRQLIQQERKSMCDGARRELAET